ncbi:MAG: 4-hydroxythreonine-4-phosphate dehydrogenase PdxA [Phycisphaerales bacterium JB043]
MGASGDRHPESTTKPTISVSMGDPLGIGPEVVVKALDDPQLRASARFLIRGSAEAMQFAADLAEIEPYWWRVQHDSPAAMGAVSGVVILDYDEFGLETAPGYTTRGPRPTRQGGIASFAFVEHCIEDAKRPENDPLRADAIVTAPISKRSWDMAGRGKYPGHTELLATRFRSRRHAMMFVSPRLRVILATAHIGLNEIRNVLTIGRVFEPIDLGSQACVEMGIERPRVAVCGLNPHAGEGGLFGDEEERLIVPAIRLARDAGIDAHGPYPSDTIFNSALDGKFDLVVAMYHDQGLIPIKLLAWKNAVNVTVGLPIVRTSPDHGTGFDIAGQNKADASSMRAALWHAVRMTKVRGGHLERATQTT